MERSILTLHLRAVGARPDAAGVENMFAGRPGVLDAAIDPASGTVRLEIDGRVFRFRGLGRPAWTGLRASDPAPQPDGPPHDGPSPAPPIPGATGGSLTADPV